MFLILGLLFGIIGNFFASFLVEFLNALIETLTTYLKITFWAICVSAVTYPLLLIMERGVIRLMGLGVGFSNDDIKEIRRTRTYNVAIMVALTIVFVLLLIIK